MKIVENPKEYLKFIERWDKGDGRTNGLVREQRSFKSPDINDTIRDEKIVLPAGKSIILVDVLADDLVSKYPHLVTKEYTEPKPKKKPVVRKKTALKRVSLKRSGRKKKNVKK